MKKSIWLIGLLIAGCSSSNVVVVYSPHGAEMLGDYEALFEAAHPEVDVQAIDMGAKDAYTKVRAESSRPQCDVWWGGPSTLFMQAADEGLLAPYTPAWADKLAPEFKDPEGRWHATYRSPIAIMFNDRHYKMEDVPQTWDALLDPKWKGKISLRSPLESGTMRTFISAMVDRAESDDAGIAWLKQLDENTDEFLGSPGMLYDHLKKNPDHISVWLMPDIVMQAVRNAMPFGYHVPVDTPVLTDCIALVKGGSHEEWAKKFYDFVTTEEALLQQATEYAKLPARSDIDSSKLPPKLVAQPVKPMAIDWAEFAAKEKDWCDRWKAEVFDAP